VLGPKSLLVWRCCYFMSLWMKLQVTSNFHEMTASLHQHAVGTRNTPTASRLWCEAQRCSQLSHGRSEGLGCCCWERMGEV
jgi:hypothetical protein